MVFMEVCPGSSFALDYIANIHNLKGMGFSKDINAGGLGNVS